MAAIFLLSAAIALQKGHGILERQQRMYVFVFLDLPDTTAARK